MRTGIEEFLKTLKSTTFHKLMNSSLPGCCGESQGSQQHKEQAVQGIVTINLPVNTSSFSAQFLWPTEEFAGGHGHMGVPQTANSRGCHEVTKSTQSMIPYSLLCLICLEPVGGH